MSASDRAAALVQPRLLDMQAYQVPDATGMVKLDAMENPYGWPVELRDAWLEMLGDVSLNRYPDSHSEALDAALRDYLSIPAEYGVLFGNGSDELIQLLCVALRAPGRRIGVPEPTFSMYRVCAEPLGFGVVELPVRADDFGPDADALLAKVRTEQPSLIFIATPNNPTGRLFERDVLRELAGAADGLIVIDEAYQRFAGGSLMGEFAGADNVVFMQTLSKIGLAGLRLGALVGPRPWLAQLDKVRLPYNINSLSERSAVFALSHQSLIEEQAARIIAERERVLAAMQAVYGVQVWPSATNFLMFRLAGAAEDFHRYLIEQRILIKKLHGAQALLKDCLRVTIGRPDENELFLAALRDFQLRPG
ncbi:MAG: histidinol-phosphate transaminase [Gammaproteobacteria bacterium]|nr:histidinol-phosphate transaminase [Gammaproteobacteria bacterium]